ncbi:hypothetical protein CsatB_020966 [Cannabis sativa]
MPDLGRLLREDFNLVLSCVHWITAWSIRNKDLKSSSIPFLKKMAEISGYDVQFDIKHVYYNFLQLIHYPVLKSTTLKIKGSPPVSWGY